MIRQQLKLLFRFGVCKSVALGRFFLHQDTLTLTGLPRRTLYAKSVSSLLGHSAQSRRCCTERAQRRFWVPFSVLILEKTPPAPDLQKTVKPSRVRFHFAMKRATWRTVR
jgi:hypothetical protein